MLSRSLRISLTVAGAWTAVALVFASQGYAIDFYRGSPQPWWPSLGYALAIFSIWAVMTPVIVAGARRTARLALPPRLLALAVGLPAAAAVHVMLFALIYWPVYNGDGRIPTRRAMAEHMAFRNLDTNALVYLLVVGWALWRELRARPAAVAPVPDSPRFEPLRVRSRGRLLLMPPAAVDWIAAAGDYVELHAGNDVHLADETLAALERSLPAGEFARIHRGALVRIDRVAEVRGIGRGDALVRLATGAELRMSRRYRANLAALLEPKDDSDPAHPHDWSRSPNSAGEAA